MQIEPFEAVYTLYRPPTADPWLWVHQCLEADSGSSQGDGDCR
jgi:hypothetical protein